jgi:hypothetical protein
MLGWLTGIFHLGAEILVMKFVHSDTTSSMSISRTATAVALLLAPLVASAGPSVTSASGTVSQGQALQISGSGFGTRASYNNNGDTWDGGKFLNFRFKDFEDGNLNSHGFYPQSGGAEWTPSGTELNVLSGGPSNSSKYMRRQYGQEDGGLSADIAGAGNQVYTTFKFMIAPGTQSGKFWRLYGDAPQTSVYLSTGCTDTWIRGATECTAGSCSGAQTQWGAGPQMSPGVWHRIEFWVDANSNTFTAYIDGTQAWTEKNWLNTSLTANGHTMDFPNMIDSGSRNASCPATGSYNYDDIYIDFTQARVEIGDASTWAAVQHKEVQIPTAWSDSAIQVRVNPGAFSSGDKAWLYVVNSSGAVNASGLPVTISQAATGAPPPATPPVPNPPTDIQVN